MGSGQPFPGAGARGGRTHTPLLKGRARSPGHTNVSLPEDSARALWTEIGAVNPSSWGTWQGNAAHEKGPAPEARPGDRPVPRHSREGPWQGPLGARGSSVLESLYGGREVKTHHVLRRPAAAGSGFRGDTPPGAGCGLPAVGVRGRAWPR